MEDDLVGRIYECALAPELWPDVLDGIAAVAEAAGAVFYARDMRTGTVRWTASPALHEDAHAYFSGGWLWNDRRRSATLEASYPGFLTEVNLYGAEFEADPTVRDFHARRGRGRVVVTGLALPTGEAIAFAAERDLAAGPASPAVVARMDALRPHIARSLFMGVRLQMERARLMGEALALMGVPALVLDQQGRALAVNTLMDGMAAHLAWRADDFFGLRDKRADPQLRDAILRLGADDAPSVRSFAVRDADGAAALVAHVIPVRGTARDVFSRCAGVLVLTPVAMPEAAPVELLASLFDLSPAEARVARELVAGATLDEIAAANRVSSHTVRTQMKEVLGKTGCHRQAEVVALLGGIAAPRG